MKNAHSGQTRFTYLCCADEVETALRRKAHLGLPVFANSQAASPDSEAITAIVQLSEVPTDFTVGEKA
jgi:hypothetical protein